jgi:hypothetical protein
MFVKEMRVPQHDLSAAIVTAVSCWGRVSAATRKILETTRQPTGGEPSSDPEFDDAKRNLAMATRRQ